MVIGAFPIAKLSVLLIKQISKPIANVCKENAKNHPFFRTYVCMPPAQFYNWCEVKAKMWVLNLGKPVNIPVLSQEMAIDLGANLLGESVIFVIGAALLIFEYNRQSKKEAVKEFKRQEEINHIMGCITDMYFTVQQQQTQLKEMERILTSMSGVKLTTPAPELHPPEPPKVYSDDECEQPPKLPSPGTVPANKSKPDSNPHTPTPQKMSYDHNNNFHYTTSTPYPDKGIILKSLNYIQMDALSSLFPKNGEKKLDEENSYIKNNHYESAVITETLQNIENNFRSLF